MAASRTNSDRREKRASSSFPFSDMKPFLAAATCLTLPSEREMTERLADNMMEVKLPLVHSSFRPDTVVEPLEKDEKLAPLNQTYVSHI